MAPVGRIPERTRCFMARNCRRLHSPPVMKRIVILLSGRGTNMEAIVRACAAEGWPAQVAAVISNRADAAGLEFARSHGIAAVVVDHKTFATRDAFDTELARRIDAFAPDAIVLAGFMRILGDAFVQ